MLGKGPTQEKEKNPSYSTRTARLRWRPKVKLVFIDPLGSMFEAIILQTPDDTDFHIGLLPQPYFGNLKSASIFILMLNPGLSPGDYYAEQRDPVFRRALIRSLRQENEGDEYPFIFLNPQFAWHPGFSYFHKRFARMARKIKDHEGSYSKALSFLAKHIACLQLIPYHSRKLGSYELLGELQSTRTMLDFVHRELKDRTNHGEVTIIVERGSAYWKLAKGKDVIVYKGSQIRGAWLTPKAEKKLEKRLDLLTNND